MGIRRMQWTALAAAVVLSAGSAFAADGADVNVELQALKTRIAELEKKENENWLTAERASQIKELVQEVITDSRKRGQFADGDLQAGYKDGFFVQTADQNFKLVVGGFAQVRYEYAMYHNSHVGGPSGTNTTPFPQGNQQNANGFDIRRARISFSGNAFSKDITFKLEGDFYNGSEVAAVDYNKSTGNSTSGNFVVTDAFLGYRFTDMFKLRAGSFKVPFTKAELMSDTTIGFMERPEENAPFDAQRAIGLSLYGDITPNTLTYEVNVNNGSNSNTFRRDTTASTVATSKGASNYTTNPNFNLDNRLGFYGRMNWSPTASVSEIMSGESDLRKDNSEFVWMLGAAAGYESQNSNTGTFDQNTAAVSGLGGNNGPGYTGNYTLNGDLYRATVDWSAKYRGWSFLTAAYFQQVNANPVSGTASTALPYGTGKASFFEHAYYGQVGYMIIPQKLELVTRAGVLLEEGDPNIGEFYSVGANYYLFGNNAKISTDVTYTPEAPYTDAGASLIQNTHEVAFRVQLQLKF